jgi:hypothetical protein
MELELKTTKTVASEKSRLARCDDDGRLEVVTKIDQTTPGITDSVTVKSGTVPLTFTVTRPNDILPYLAGDVIGSSTSTTAAVKLTNIALQGGVIRITGTRHEIDVAAIPSGMTSFRLHLYNAIPPSAFVDNAAWDLPAGDRASYIGYVDLGSPADLGSTLYVQQTGLDYDFAVIARDLWCYTVTNGAYTPTALAVKTTTLFAMPL